MRRALGVILLSIPAGLIVGYLVVTMGTKLALAGLVVIVILPAMIACGIKLIVDE